MYRREYSKTIANLIAQGAQTIRYSFMALWLSGIGFVFIGQSVDPIYVLNQKIWAKVMVVFVMSVNAVYLHKVVLPKFTGASRGFDLNSILMDPKFRLSFCVSAAGWGLATFFGLAKFLNHSYYQLFAIYVILVTLMFGASYLVPVRTVRKLQPA